ncbi:hypothetical protein EMG21_30020 [Klebsiella pneumoniae]|nr:hypothetical protein EMG21_30020 [Klebsiella pneumoniae]
MLSDREHRFYRRLLKRIVVLDVLEKAIAKDIDHLEHIERLKTGSVLKTILSEVKDRARSDRIQALKEMEAEGGGIIEIRQTEQAREVKTTFKGYHFNHAYLNSVLQSDCENTLLNYLSCEEGRDEI